jgi:hypothetical protein
MISKARDVKDDLHLIIRVGQVHDVDTSSVGRNRGIFEIHDKSVAH